MGLKRSMSEDSMVNKYPDIEVISEEDDIDYNPDFEQGSIDDDWMNFHWDYNEYVKVERYSGLYTVKKTQTQWNTYLDWLYTKLYYKHNVMFKMEWNDDSFRNVMLMSMFNQRSQEFTYKKLEEWIKYAHKDNIEIFNTWYARPNSTIHLFK